jgi:hypothetical protein
MCSVFFGRIIITNEFKPQVIFIKTQIKYNDVETSQHGTFSYNFIVKNN